MIGTIKLDLIAEHNGSIHPKTSLKFCIFI